MITSYDYDIVFCTLPPLSVERLYSAPAVLKTVAQSAGYRSRCFDFVMDMFNGCNRDLAVMESLNRKAMVTNYSLTENEQDLINRFIDHVTTTLIKSNSRYFGFTIFSGFTHYIATQIIFRLKELGLNDKVVLGGRGLTTEPYVTVIDCLDITEEDKSKEFGDILVEKGYVKYTIKGDGEEALLQFLSSTKIEPGLNRNTEMKAWYPDYDDFDFSMYLWPKGKKVLEITGSTGCVRNCDFCDVRKQFGKFKYKIGSELAEELIYNQQRYGVSSFHFTDSLVNGGMKHFRMFLSKIVEHNSTAATPIDWAGFYICRDIDEFHADDDYFILMKQAGAGGLTIGAESGSNRVLDAMDKKSTVESIFYELGQFRRYDITTQMLSFVGHWREEHEDFIEHCKMIIKFAPYVRSGNIVSISLGYPFKMIPGTPAWYNIDIIKDSVDADLWLPRSNRGNTLKTRMQRRLIISKLSNALKIGVEYDEANVLNSLIATIDSNHQQIQSFFEKHASGNHDQFMAIADADAFVHQMLNYKETFEIDLTIQASSFNGDPHVRICVDENILLDADLSDGEHSFKFTLDKDKLGTDGIFEIALTNKGQFDTQVDEHNNIIKDKFISVKKLLVDDCDLLLDIDFCQKNFKYKNSNSPAYTLSLFATDSLQMNFGYPFVWWYSSTSTKNSKNEMTAVYNQLYDNQYLDQLRATLESKIKYLSV